MDPLVYFFFVREMEKLSATVAELGAAVKRLPLVRLPKGGSLPYGNLMHVTRGLNAAFEAPGGAMRYLEKKMAPVRDRLRAISPDGKKGVNLTGIFHEGMENQFTSRLAPGEPLKRQFRGVGYNHSDPKVITSERNLIGGLTGPGADETRRVMRAYRGRGEAGILADALEDVGGSRAVATYGDYGAPNKLPKAMRKRVEQRMADIPKERQQALLEQIYRGRQFGAEDVRRAER